MKPEGCKICERGGKLVLFITGLCRDSCYYCPLSEKRRNKDVVYANEREVLSEHDIIEEARLMDAEGTGITGGDPIVKLERTIRYASLLKNEFRNHHIHLYTSGTLCNDEVFEQLEPRIDEIRFHPQRDWDIIETALKYDFDVGAEIPTISKKYIEKFVKYLDNIGAKFLNLNELEYSETNIKELKKRGFKFKEDAGVKGSEEIALDIVKKYEDLDLMIHYCSSNFKDAVQLRKRLERRAENVKKPYEEIEDSLIVKGVIECEDLDAVYDLIMTHVDIDTKMIERDYAQKKIYLHWFALSEITDLLENREVKAGIVKEYPTYVRKKMEYIPLV
ncbi:MAG: radical SAM protein [Euryarchaeota archaeon]|nr:radical SAM protein [Euryarchaeota archaeon]